MAANNYFGFTHGGTQYGAQPAAAYPAAQTAYVQPAQTAYAVAAAPRAAQTYETYPAAAPSGTYAYATRTAQAPPPPPTATQTYQDAYYARAATPITYDATKTYYQNAAQAIYTVAESPYQAGRSLVVSAKPTYTTNTTSYTTQQLRPVTVQKTIPQTTYTQYSVAATATTAAGATYAAPVTTTAGSLSGSVYAGRSTIGYDAALYSAATNYYQQQQATKTVGAAWKYKPTPAQLKKGKPQPPKSPQLHYCEVCKISCAGPQTYREHLEGQKHKKKEAASKASVPTAVGRGQNQLRCELCDVSCTGSDAYAAHIRGTKHQKVLKLHARLGKPIPSTDPVVVAGGASGTISGISKPVAGIVTSATKMTAVGVRPGAAAGTTIVKKLVTAAPKITFIGGTQLKTTGIKTEEVKAEAAATVEAEKSQSEEFKLSLAEKDIQPVGYEYIEEVKNELGKTVSFNCKLCECKFNDPNAKEMHMKGRRHRLQYKKKVDPSLQVEVKPSIRARKIQEEKLKRQSAREDFWRRRDHEERWHEEMSRMEEELFWRTREDMDMVEWGRRPVGRGMPGRPFPGRMPMMMAGRPMRKPDTNDDRHVMAKHASIYPNEQELAAVQNIVSSVEKALKLVSDFIAEIDGPKPMETDKKGELPVKVKEEKTEEGKEEEKKEEVPTPPRLLKGVMRVGVLAKGLLLHGDLNVHLIVLCSEKPTRTMLERVADSLPKQLATVTEDKFDVKLCVEDAACIVSFEKEPQTTCTITLTSPIMRDENAADGAETVTAPKDPPDVLDRQKCLEALAALRHAKWFQARANGLQSCVVVIRLLRDLCQRVPTWAPLNQWAMELLVEKCVSSGGPNMSPGDALRRVFECIASGILLPGGPGLYNPCEKDPYDSASSLSNQEREDITASAQHALRLIAFRQIHKVLGMDQLPQPRFLRQRFITRKRRRTNSAGESVEGEGGEKKDKKEEATVTAATSGK